MPATHCPRCRVPLTDAQAGAAVCPACGAPLRGAPPGQALPWVVSGSILALAFALGVLLWVAPPADVLPKKQGPPTRVPPRPPTSHPWRPPSVGRPAPKASGAEGLELLPMPRLEEDGPAGSK
jgi:hypothetical protein